MTGGGRRLEMAIFSVGREDDSEGPSSPRPKKQRTTPTRDEENQRQINDQLVEHQEKEESESESDSEDEDSEDSEADEEEEEDNRIERERTTAVQLCNTASDVGREPSAGNRGDSSISVTLTDPDVLDCPICLDHLRIPVFQCENGHIACSSCCTKLGHRCPSCLLPIGYNRCRAIEKVLESVKVSCQYLKHGCKETVSYSNKHDHEEACSYAPYSCPIPDCNFSGSFKDFSLHFSLRHSISTIFFRYNCLLSLLLQKQEKHLVLLEQNEGIIFILNNGIEHLGNVISFSCVGLPRRVLSYELIARNGGSSVKLQSTIESVRRLVEPFPPKRFLLIPSDFVTSCGQLKLELCIRRLR